MLSAENSWERSQCLECLWHLSATYLDCAQNPDGLQLDISTNSDRSGNLYSHPEIVVYEACPHLTTSNSPPDSRATFWSISLCRNSIQRTRLHITVCIPHNAMCAAIDTSFPILMQIDQWASVTSDTVRSLSTHFSEKQNLSVTQWYSSRHVIDTAQ